MPRAIEPDIRLKHSGDDLYSSGTPASGVLPVPEYGRGMAEPADTTPSDDVKRKFREALDRKNQAQHDRPAHLDGESAVHESKRKAGGKREFRRKSG